MTTTLVLFLVAAANLFSKKIATIYGLLFTIVLFAVFTISERINARQRARRQKDEPKGLEEFRIDVERDVTDGRIHARPGSILVAVRDYNNMQHLQSVLRKTNMRRHDIVVV